MTKRRWRTERAHARAHRQRGLHSAPGRRKLFSGGLVIAMSVAFWIGVAIAVLSWLNGHP